MRQILNIPNLENSKLQGSFKFSELRESRILGTENAKNFEFRKLEILTVWKLASLAFLAYD